MLKIVAACAMGAGSSLMMEMKIKQVCKELGIDAAVSHCQISEAKSTAKKYDVVVTALNFVSQFKAAEEAGVKVIAVKNILSAAEIKEKFIAAEIK
ncbi:MAG: PTS sugar transporter subunit IIB [Erysipelotrichaceae bacterium]|nr:PTS sugar transporter subunit IIB [Erysipelotrichaceae bacterium]